MTVFELQLPTVNVHHNVLQHLCLLGRIKYTPSLGALFCSVYTRAVVSDLKVTYRTE